MKTLLTGFGPFGDVVDNPTTRVVAHFAADPERRAPGHKLTTRVLPVSFARADEEITVLLRSGEFDAALLLGVAAGDAEFRVERLGRNSDHARIPDTDGAVPLDTPIRLGAPDCLPCTADADGLLRLLHDAGLPARLSDSAGGYVCNRAYFAALHAISQIATPCACLFLHVPPDPLSFAAPDDRPTLPLDRHIAAVRMALDWMRR